jgi:four helix bundle protein
MTMSRSFKDLIVWQKGVVLVKEVYRVTGQLPKTEQFGLVSQLNRAAISVPSNIAEGAKRGTTKDFLQFLRIASGSAAEIETQLVILGDVYPNIDTAHAENVLEEIQKMLTTMIRKM